MESFLYYQLILNLALVVQQQISLESALTTAIDDVRDFTPSHFFSESSPESNEEAQQLLQRSNHLNAALISSVIN